MYKLSGGKRDTWLTVGAKVPSCLVTTDDDPAVVEDTLEPETTDDRPDF